MPANPAFFSQRRRISTKGKTPSPRTIRSMEGETKSSGATVAWWPPTTVSVADERRLISSKSRRTVLTCTVKAVMPTTSGRKLSRTAPRSLSRRMSRILTSWSPAHAGGEVLQSQRLIEKDILAANGYTRLGRLDEQDFHNRLLPDVSMSLRVRTRSSNAATPGSVLPSRNSRMRRRRWRCASSCRRGRPLRPPPPNRRRR